jgi:hypothetical protein
MWIWMKFTFIGFVIAASDPAANDLLHYADKLSVIAILFLIGFGAYKEWWVPGPRYNRIVKERDQLLDLALKNATLAQRGIDTAEKVIQ